MAIHELPRELSIQRHAVTTHGGDLISSQNFRDNCIDFFRLPPVTSPKPIERWSTPPFSFRLEAYATYPLCNVLAAAEAGER